jgi:hypothetical protein
MSDTEEELAEEGPQVLFHEMAPGVEYIEESDTFPGGGFVYYTKCGLIINEEAIGITDNPDDLTCEDCRAA